MKVNIYDVSKRAGVSVVTVSRVINNLSSVREKNRQKVLQAMKDLNYHPNAAARSLARGKTGLIGVMVPNINDYFFNGVVGAINDYLEEHGYFLALSIMSKNREGNRERGTYLFQEDRVDGLIILSPVHEDEYIVELKRKKIPFVLLDNQQNHPSVSSIIVDNYKAGYDATKHLLELGHTKIGHIMGQEIFLSSKERERGFREALTEVGLTPHVAERGEFTTESGYLITKKWIEENTLPTAIFAADDYMAYGAIDALKIKGLRVPEDVAIVGCDDQFFSSEFHPTLTTIRQPAEEIGRKSVETLMKLMKGELKRSVTLKLEPQLIIRESTTK
ncbi:MAG: LacI family transcriptional regulator [Clostridia bacterium]|nr:LacI family transcriptional regulator [Clostridia bacterium]